VSTEQKEIYKERKLPSDGNIIPLAPESKVPELPSELIIFVASCEVVTIWNKEIFVPRDTFRKQ
jgi:hypothetical protein